MGDIMALKQIVLILFICVLLFIPMEILHSQSENTEFIQLIVRGDDMGMAHSVNEAIIKAYKEGVMRTVELMVPCPWFPEAVKLLKENPGLDVGIHLVLTSEWDAMKWRPLTCAPGLINDEGNFYPTVWDDERFPPGSNVLAGDWKIEEVEADLRAQIELATRNLPRISHLSDHMAFTRADSRLKRLVEKLAKEYDLEVNLEDYNVKYAGGFGGAQTTAEQKTDTLAAILERLTPGRWIFIDHPGLDTPELQALSHPGYENVAADRAGVTRAFTSEKVLNIIRRRGIKLIGYSALKMNK